MAYDLECAYLISVAHMRTDAGADIIIPDSDYPQGL